MQFSQPMNVLSFGLGPIGLEILKQCQEATNINVIGAVDIDPEKVGKDIGLLIGKETKGINVVSSMKEFKKPDNDSSRNVAIHATGSNLENIWPQIKQLLDHGFSVVSTCEELSYPMARYPELAKEIDEYTRKKHLTVLGTGVNPGFVMDTLVLCLSSVTKNISCIKVSRKVDVSKRRLPLQKKVGVGMEKDVFEQLAEKGKIGHVGLEESVRLIAYGLNLQITDVSNSIEPTISKVDQKVNGLHQTSITKTKEGKHLVLDLIMSVGVNQADEIVITGDESQRLVIPGGIFGDTATASIAINNSKLVHSMSERGLKTMADIGLPRNLYLQ